MNEPLSYSEWKAQPEEPLKYSEWKAQQASGAEHPVATAPDTDTNPVKFAANSINRGVAGAVDNVINAPQNIENLARAAVGYGLHKIGAPASWMPEAHAVPDLMRRGMESAGVIDDKLNPTSTAGKIADYAIQMATGAAMSPGNAVKNVLGGLFGGTVGGTVQELTDSPLAGIAASFVAPGAAAAIRSGNRSHIYGKGIENSAADTLITTSGLDKQSLIDALEKRKTFIPGSDPTTAQALKNTGLAGIERTYKNMPGTLEGDGISIPAAFETRYAEQRRAQANAMRDLAPTENGAEGFKLGIKQIAQGHINTDNNAAMSAINGVSGTSDKLIDGAMVRGIIDNNYKAQKKTTGNAYGEIDPGDISRVNIPYDALLEAVKNRHPLYGDAIPPQVSSLLKIAKNWGIKETPASEMVGANGKPLVSASTEATEVPLSIVGALRAIASRDAHETGLAGQAHASGTLGDMKRILNNVPEDAAQAGLIPQDMAERVKNAVAQRKIQGDLYETGAANRLNRTNSDNSNFVEDQNVLPTFINKSNEAAKSFIASTGGDQAAKNVAENYLGEQFRRSMLTQDGVPKKGFSDSSSRFGRDYAAPLGIFPDLKGRISTAVSKQKQAVATSELYQNGGTREFMGGKDANKSIESWLASPSRTKDTREILNAVGMDAGLKNQLKGALRDRLLEKTMQNGSEDILGLQKWNQGNALKEAKDPKNKVLAAALLDRPGKAKAERITRDLERTQFSKDANRSSGSDTFQNSANAAIQTGLVRALSGKTGGLVGMASALNDKLRAGQSTGIMAKMLLDPEYSVKLLKNQSETGMEYLRRNGQSIAGRYLSQPYKQDQ